MIGEPSVQGSSATRIGRVRRPPTTVKPPLLRIEDLFDHLQGARVFSKINLRSGIPLIED